MAIEDEQGIYLLDEIPGKPHPHCYCYLTAANLPTLEELEAALANGDFDTAESKFSEDPDFNTRLSSPSEVFKPTGKRYRDWEGSTEGLFNQPPPIVDSNFSNFPVQHYSSAELRAMESYKASAYRTINEELRAETWQSGVFQEEIPIIDDVLSRSTLNRDLLTYRGTNPSEIFRHFDVAPSMESMRRAYPAFSDNDDVLKAMMEAKMSSPNRYDFVDESYDYSRLVGQVYRDRGFSSTRLAEDGPFSDKKVQFRINSPKGSSAYYYGDNDREKEVLLPRDTELVITGVEYVDGTLWIDVLRN